MVRQGGPAAGSHQLLVKNIKWKWKSQFWWFSLIVCIFNCPRIQQLLGHCAPFILKNFPEDYLIIVESTARWPWRRCCCSFSSVTVQSQKFFLSACCSLPQQSQGWAAAPRKVQRLNLPGELCCWFAIGQGPNLFSSERNASVIPE